MGTAGKRRLLTGVVRASPSAEAIAGPNWSFVPFLLQKRRRHLLIDGTLFNLGSRAFSLLILPVRSGGDLLIKVLILDRVWPKVVVEEHNLHVNER